jgi:histidinol-phosphate/aromatic aminotransferase/cobyric acid decarboxylase-like protein/choline kinase
MKAIILAAGYGRRMQPLSTDCHKALLSVGGATILGRIVDTLKTMPVNEIIVVTGYRADDIRRFLVEQYAGTRFTFVHNERFAETNNIVSLSLALDRTSFDEDVLLVECDLLFEPSVLTRLSAMRGNVALVDRYRPGMDGTVVAVDNGIITHVFPPHLQGPDFHYGDKFKTLNIYRFDAEFCKTTFQPLLNCYANLIDGNCYYELVLGTLVNMQRQRIAADVVDGASWVEVDDPNDLAVARFQFEPARRAEVLDRCFGGYWNFDLLDFSFMRNAYFPTDGMMAALRQALPDLIRNYGSSQRVLNEKLAYVVRCGPDRLEALHGASQAFPILRELLRGRSIAMPSPTFGEYARAFPSAAIYRDAPGVDLDEIDGLAARHQVLVAVNPNTPTGTTISTAWLHALAVRRPNTLIIVDESFVAFSGEEPLVQRLEREPLANVMVLMSLGKQLGAPGLRSGFVYSCDRSWLDAIADRLPIWNLSAPAEFLIELLLKFRTEFDATIAQTLEDRARFADALQELPLVDHVFPSGGNFLLVRLASSDAGFAGGVRRELLAQRNMDVKDVSRRFDDGAPYIRVGVRRPDENARLIAALSELPARL